MYWRLNELILVENRECHYKAYIQLCSTRLPKKDGHLVVFVAAEEVALRLVDDVGAEVLANDAVP